MESPSPLERRLAGALVKTLFLRNRRGGPWMPPARLTHRPVQFEGNTGARLAGLWFPHEKPRGTVVLAHPDRRYGKHWFVREGWVDFLHDAGYEVLTFDFVGYGESRGPATYYHEDVVAAAKLAQEWSGFLPVSVIGVSMGAFAVANASPKLGFVRALVLESPYPSFNDWYGQGAYLHAMRAFDRLFPRSSAAIQAHENIARAQAPRLLVASSPRDEVTPPALTRRVADAAPVDRTRVLQVDAPHLQLFENADYRRAILDTLGGGSGATTISRAASPSAGRAA